MTYSELVTVYVHHCFHIDFSFLSSAPSNPPTNFTVTIVNSTTFLMAWDDPELQYQNGLIRYYSISVHETETAQNFSFISGDRMTAAALFHPSFTYILAVAAVTVEEGPLSETVTVTATEDGKLQYHLFCAIIINHDDI